MLGINDSHTIVITHTDCTPFYLNFTVVIAMAGLNYYKPKFNWDSVDKLSELDRFKAECDVLFNGLLDESPPK